MEFLQHWWDRGATGPTDAAASAEDGASTSVGAAEPAFGRRIFVLIEDAVNAFGAQAVGQLQHTISVRRRILAVTDEDGGCCHGLPHQVWSTLSCRL